MPHSDQLQEYKDEMIAGYGGIGKYYCKLQDSWNNLI